MRCRRANWFPIRNRPEARHKVERFRLVGGSGLQESRETINQAKQTSLALNQETHNYKPNHCKQIKRNSFELAKFHRLFTVENKEKTRRLLNQEIERIDELPSNVPEREQINTNKVAVKSKNRASISLSILNVLIQYYSFTISAKSCWKNLYLEELNELFLPVFRIRQTESCIMSERNILLILRNITV